MRAPERTPIRIDLQLIADMIEPSSRVLDVGCGDGALLDYLVHLKGVDGRGIELGADGVLMNTGIAAATDPVRMAVAMRLAVDAGRLAYLAGRMPRREVAVPSSPTTGMLDR